MATLTINEIKIWLKKNRHDYQKLRAEEYPSFNNHLLFLYPQLHQLMRYYSMRQKCEEAVNNLKLIFNKDFTQFESWTQQYEILGSKHFLMFEINYFDWIEEVEEGLLKIREGLYTKRDPFENILCFCKIFQIVYWDNSLHNKRVTDQELFVIKKHLKRILNKYYNAVN